MINILNKNKTYITNFNFTFAKKITAASEISSKIAFTLAEVLITLGIIGIVAAMTLPALTAKYQKVVTATELKKSYSTILQAFTMAQKDYGDISQWEFIKTQSVSGDDLSELKNSLDFFAKTYLIPYIKVVTDCGSGKDSSKACYYPWYYSDRSIINYSPGDNIYRFIINNSTLIQLQYDNYEGNFGGRILLSVDINGMQKPNTWGKDVFLMGISQSNSKFNMFGYEQKSRDTLMNHSSWGCKTSKTTYYCGAVIQQDGWEIKDDYPWF